MRSSHFDEQEHQEDEEDLCNTLEEDRQHWCEVEGLYDEIEVSSCASAARWKEKSVGQAQRR